MLLIRLASSSWAGVGLRLTHLHRFRGVVVVGYFPVEGSPADSVLRALRSLAAADMDPRSGRMFGHSYETGLEEVYRVAVEAYTMFMWKTMLDFTVYPSVLKLEQEVVGAVAELVHAGPEATGSFTYGGTESIMLAVRSARGWWARRRPGVRPKLVMPLTGHPAFAKAADYLGFELVRTPVDPGTLRADVDALLDAVDDRTAFVALSAPNYPYGTVDPVREVAEGLEGRVWLHVDACMGGFILPFLEELGIPVPAYDFRVEGVYSMSVDLHKYGYAPKGASVVVYRSEDLRLHQLYVDVHWPGYPFVNEAVLSTRSAGPLAASWAVLRLLGRSGYRELARRALNARDRIASGLKRLGFRVLPTDSTLLAFTSEEVSLPALAAAMRERGWYIQYQPGLPSHHLPPSIHLTIAPVHDRLAVEFLEDLEEALQAVRGRKPLALAAGELGPDEALKLLAQLGVARGELPRDLTLVEELVTILPRDIVEELLRRAVNTILSPRLEGTAQKPGQREGQA